MNNFAKLRKKAGLTQATVSAAINVDRSTVAKWETGVAKPCVDKLLNLAKLYNCSTDDLLKSDNRQT